MTSSDMPWIQAVAALWSQYDSLPAETFLDNMRTLVAQQPTDDPLALYELGSAHDSIGQEEAAAPLYREALSQGLAAPYRRRATIQLASTLRNLGQAAAGVAPLTAEQAAPADELDDAVAAFLALCLADLGREREALKHVAQKCAAVLGQTTCSNKELKRVA